MEDMPEVLHLVRLLDEAGEAFAVKLSDCVSFVVPATENNTHIGIQGPQLAVCFVAVHHRHRQVEQNADNIVPRRLVAFKSLAAIAGGQNGEPEMAQHATTDLDDEFFVINQQDGTTSTPRIVLVLHGGSRSA